MGRQGLCSAYFLTVDKQADKYNKMSQARAADVEKMKLQMMQAMNIKDPKELQRMAREYCKDMAVELTLPAYHRLATQISRSITKNREVFDALSSTEKVVQLMKAVMEDMEIVEGFKMALDQEDKDATICPELSSDKPSPVTPTARFCCTACLKTGMESYHPVEAKTNVQKLFWSKREERYEETSGNILLTLRSVTQKPLQYFLDNKDFTKVDETFGVEFSSPEDKVCFSDYKNLSNLEGHRDEQSKDEALGVTINSVILLVLLRNGGYFGPKETPYGAVLSAQEKQMAAVIVHLQEGIRYNLHQIMEVEKTNISCLSMPQN